jgi:hypothetical protein
LRNAALVISLLLLLVQPAGVGRRRPQRTLCKPFPILHAQDKGFSLFLPRPPRTGLAADTIEVALIGDVMMHTKQLDYDYRTFLEGIQNRLKGADLAIANMEFTLAGKPYSGYPAFSAPDGYPAYIRDCGVDVFLTANNHILDKGKAGAERTERIYESMEGVRYTGLSSGPARLESSYPLFLNVRGIRLALVNFTYGTNAAISSEWPKVNRMDRNEISKAIAKARARGADFVIALPHWGTEYKLRHDQSQENMARWLAGEGVDAIVGAHPHVVQDSSVIDGVPVYYSLGNAVSNMSAINTRLELLVTLRFTINPEGVKEMLGSEAEYLWCTRPGTLTDGFMTIAVSDYEGKRRLWKDPSDYDNMIATRDRVSSAVGID